MGSISPPKMQHIDPTTLDHLPSRISYLTSFLEVTSDDADALNAAIPLIAPLIPSILDAVYGKLLSFDITAQSFVPAGTDYTGPTVKNVQELTLEHPQIAMRKDFLKNYLVKLVSLKDLSPESQFWDYLNKVAVMHTGKPGFKHRQNRPDLRVEYVHMGLLLGYVVNVVVGAVMQMDEVDNAMKSKVMVALNKIVWIQNDLFARCYVVTGSETEAAAKIETKQDVEAKCETGHAGCPFHFADGVKVEKFGHVNGVNDV